MKLYRLIPLTGWDKTNWDFSSMKEVDTFLQYNVNKFILIEMDIVNTKIVEGVTPTLSVSGTYDFPINPIHQGPHMNPYEPPLDGTADVDRFQFNPSSTCACVEGLCTCKERA